MIVGIFTGNLGVYLSEIYPSVYRGIGVSFSTFIGRIGNIVATVLIGVMETMKIQP
jgi:hypothetical protein